MIRQMRGEIECKAPELKLLHHKAMEKMRACTNHEILHMKREWKQSTDRLAGKALQREQGKTVTTEQECQDLKTLNRLDELIIPKRVDGVVRMLAVTRSWT